MVRGQTGVIAAVVLLHFAEQQAGPKLVVGDHLDVLRLSSGLLATWVVAKCSRRAKQTLGRSKGRFVVQAEHLLGCEWLQTVGQFAIVLEPFDLNWRLPIEHLAD